jgi:hypothetical protein
MGVALRGISPPHRVAVHDVEGLAPGVYQLITDEGVAVGGAFDSDTATGMMPAAHRVAGVLTSWRS